MRRIINQELPDGSIRQVQPFHISLEGLKTAVLCRDDRDYDAMVKILCIAARRKNVIVIIYAVVSNHCHLAVLATCQEDAYACGQEIKKMYGTPWPTFPAMPWTTDAMSPITGGQAIVPCSGRNNLQNLPGRYPLLPGGNGSGSCIAEMT